MAPLVIADSDDEDDLGYAPESPDLPRGADCDDEGHSSGYVSLLGPVDTPGSRNASNQRGVVVQPGQRNAARYSPMSTDPLHDQTTLEKPRRPQQLSPLQDTTIATLNGTAADLHRISSSPPGPSRLVDHFERASEPDDSDRAKKRRKVDMLPSFADADELSLVELPGTEQREKNSQRQSSLFMPPPTLPYAQSSLMAEQPGSHCIEKKDHSSGTGTAADHLSQDQGPQIAPCALIRSSGSATNLNTQRSDIPFSLSFEIPFPPSSPRHPESEPTGMKNVTGSDRDVSPDERTGIERSLSALTEKRRSPVAATGACSNQDPSSHVEATHRLYEDQAVVDHAVSGTKDDSDDEYVERCARPKKQRGRPRKAAAPKTLLAEAEGAMAAKSINLLETSHDVKGKDPKKTKKKRGRPKKADRQDHVIERAVAGLVAVDEPTPESSTTSKEKPDNDDHAAIQHKGMDRTSPKDLTLHDATNMIAPPGNASPSEDADEKHKQLSNVETKPKAPQKHETPQGKNEAVKAKLLPGAQSISKPIYRVGLSKKSRIAPLLKIVRKE